MDAVTANEDLRHNIPEQAEAMKAAFHPLLEAREAEITSFATKTFKYGPSVRHQLDVYFPKAGGPENAPIVFFAYGGGYVEGSKVFDPPFQLMHKNVGAWFANQGFVTVIADYRLVPNIKFPDPATDIGDAIAYVVERIGDINAGADVKGDAERIFLIGHSAGAGIISTLMLIPNIIPTTLRQRIRGLVLMGGAYHFRFWPPPPPAVMYYESEEGVHENEPMSLLERASKEFVSTLPPVLMLVSEMEPMGVVEMNQEFRDLLSSTLDRDIPMLTMKGHNHTSVAFGLYTGQGEEWAHEVVQWIKGDPNILTHIRAKV